MKILVVGSGPLGSAVLQKLSEYRNLELVLSDYDKDQFTHFEKLFDATLPISAKGTHGLGKRWHRVSDLSKSIRNRYGKVLANSYVKKIGINKSLLDKIEKIDYCEFIPFRPRNVDGFLIRKKIIKSIRPPLLKLTHRKTFWTAEFNNNLKESFDIVFLCAGVFGNADIIERSKLGTKRKYISDHLIVSVREKLSAHDHPVFYYRNIFGFVRSFSMYGDYKVSYRPFRGIDKASLIYKTDPLSLAKELLKIRSFHTISDALNLRYSINYSSRFVRRFIQLSAKNIYRYVNGTLFVRKDRLKDLKERLAEFIGHQDFEINSGIHFWGTLDLGSSIEMLHNQNLFLFDGCNWQSAPSTHFTFTNILEALSLIAKLDKKGVIK